MSNGKTHYEWLFSIGVLVITRGQVVSIQNSPCKPLETSDFSPLHLVRLLVMRTLSDNYGKMPDDLLVMINMIMDKSPFLGGI